MKFKIFIITLLSIANMCNAQTLPNKKVKLKSTNINKLAVDAPIRKEINFGFTMLSDGWAIALQRLEYDPESANSKCRGFFMDIGEQFDPRETKVKSKLGSLDTTVQGGPAFYKYGKIYNNYQIKIGYIGRVAISGKLDPQNVRLHLIYGGSVISGLYKPYMLKLLKSSNQGGFTSSDEAYSVANADRFLNKNLIVSPSGFQMGWNKVNYSIGAMARFGFQFEYAPTKHRAVIFELGTELKSSFGLDKPIMANNDKKLVYPDVYLSAKIANRYQ
jgi:hypothetical protein